MEDINDLVAVSHERLKELSAINQTVSIIKELKSVDETLHKICCLLPNAWQHSDNSMARITYNGNNWDSHIDFITTEWIQKQEFSTVDGMIGSIEIYYLKEFSIEDEGPFLNEERSLINNIASIISGYINSENGKKIAIKEQIDEKNNQLENIKNPNSGMNLLNEFLTKINADKDVYHDLMPFKVKEILLVATLYNAFNLELEGSFSNDIFSEYHHLNLTSIPRITGVSNYEEAMEQLNNKHFDLVIVMFGVDKLTPFNLCNKIKAQFSYMPVYLLLNYDHEYSLLKEHVKENSNFDRVFVWNGNSKVFFAMVKHLEDISNVENDINVGLVDVILVIEDSSKYYSEYLPVLYDNILLQTKKMIDDYSVDEIYKLYKLRTRPKILLATKYEEAIFYYKKFKNNLLCIISDVELENENHEIQSTGIDFISEIRKENAHVPVIINSSENIFQQKAFDLNALFINKNSDTLIKDILSFVNHHLNFGSFNYKTSKGKKIAMSESLKEFKETLRIMPDDDLIMHGKKFHYSSWLKARGEINIAKIIHSINIDLFQNVNEYRELLLDCIKENIQESEKGRIVFFDKKALNDNSNIVSLSNGLLGGKGRGLAFINTLINNLDFSNLIEDINVALPRTTVIGSDEFDGFIQRNNIRHQNLDGLNDYEIKTIFVEGRLSDKLTKRIEVLIDEIKKPLAFRSSGLLEDSINQPFAGIFETYLLPNSQKDKKERLQLALDAIKLVFASVYTKIARSYIKAVKSSIEVERMAVIVQEVVGNEYDGSFYPHISGVAQSYNYYPVSHMKPEDGFATLAVGLGKYVVEGEKTFRFSPNYPEIEINSLKDQYKNSQTEFFAIDLEKKSINLLEGEDAGLIRLEIGDAERHNTLKHLASVYDIDNEIIQPGLDKPGPRVVNFVNILKYEYIPLAKTIGTILKIVEEALGCPGEIEFAVDLNKDDNYKATFYLLQIKPLVGDINEDKISSEEIESENSLLYAEKGMGNGSIEEVDDIIYVPPKWFDKMNTEEMAEEIEILNAKMIEENRKYILLGPGRWGTRDKWIGIPVNWTQISNAKVIVEYSLEDFPLDASLGSHFFHNVTANNIGYFSVTQEYDSFIKWDALENQKEIQRTKHFKHIRFEKPLNIKIDGKERNALISTN